MWPLLVIGGIIYWAVTRPGGPVQALDTVTGVLSDPSAAWQDVQGQVQTMAGSIPSAAQQYLPTIHAAAAKYGVDPVVILALGWQESKWGTTAALDLAGPGGTGDFGGRTPYTSSHWETVPGTSIVSQFPTVTRKWYPADRKGNPNGPWVIPSDGRGWGRGLMQLDWQLAQTLPWDDAVANIDGGTGVFASDLASMQSAFPGLTYPTLVRLALAAYNGGPSRVITSIHAQLNAGAAEADLNPDVTASGANLTTGGNYAANVQSFIDDWGGLGAAV